MQWNSIDFKLEFNCELLSFKTIICLYVIKNEAAKV